MTALTKPLSRRAIEPLGHYKRRVVITLLPGDRIGLRLERSRNGYIANVSQLYYTMAMWAADAEKIRRKKEREAKRKQRL